MKDLGPLNYFLGISVTRTSSSLFLSQKQYAQESLIEHICLHANLAPHLLMSSLNSVIILEISIMIQRNIDVLHVPLST